MKTKRLLSLFMAALLAVSLLAGCGGGSGSSGGSSWSLSSVKSLLTSVGCDATVKNSPEFNSAVSKVASEMSAAGSTDRDIATDKLSQIMGYSKSGSTRIGQVLLISEAELAAGEDATSSYPQLSSLMPINTINKLGAVTVAIFHEELQRELSSVNFEYSIHSVKTDISGESYWVIGFQVSLSI